MKKNLVFMAMMMSTVIFAQTTTDRSAMAEKQAQKMKSELSLNDEQFGKIKLINEKFRTGQASLLADTAMTKGDKMLESKRLQDERNNQIKGVLTKEQYSQWTAMREGKRKNMQSKVKMADRSKNDNDMEELKTALSLTDDQYKKMTAINQRIAGRIKKLRSDSTISRENVRTEMKKVQEERHAAIKVILSEEQYSKFMAYEADKINHRRPGGRPEKERSKKG